MYRNEMNKLESDNQTYDFDLDSASIFAKMIEAAFNWTILANCLNNHNGAEMYTNTVPNQKN